MPTHHYKPLPSGGMEMVLSFTPAEMAMVLRIMHEALMRPSPDAAAQHEALTLPCADRPHTANTAGPPIVTYTPTSPPADDAARLDARAGMAVEAPRMAQAGSASAGEGIGTPEANLVAPSSQKQAPHPIRAHSILAYMKQVWLRHGGQEHMLDIPGLRQELWRHGIDPDTRWETTWSRVCEQFPEWHGLDQQPATAPNGPAAGEVGHG